MRLDAKTDQQLFAKGPTLHRHPALMMRIRLVVESFAHADRPAGVANDSDSRPLVALSIPLGSADVQRERTEALTSGDSISDVVLQLKPTPDNDLALGVGRGSVILVRSSKEFGGEISFVSAELCSKSLAFGHLGLT